ncbi:hypothetical protein [Euzebya rosea]|uniref:hypothetical protein n=1 Tax=Euzebya rosea TaxID=2052804 RepID=UPI000D3ED1AE|nr:hypothetical protein [Euzebya rosea]
MPHPNPSTPARAASVTARSLHGALLVLVVLLTSFLPGGSSSAQDLPPPGIGVRLLEAPADLVDDPRAQVYVIDHLPPATTIERRFEVSNGEPTPFDVELYPVAADIRDDAFVADAGRRRNELATWITVEPSALTLQPGERAEVAMRIDVPADATRGEHYAVVFAERLPGGDVDGVQVATRVGLRVYLSVGPGGAPPIDFEIVSILPARDDDGRPGLDTLVRNTGGRAIDLSGELQLADGPGGTTAGPFDVALGTTLPPGEEGTVTARLGAALPDGPWRADMTLRSGLVERMATARLTFPSAGEVAEAVAAESTTPSSGLPTAARVGGGLGLLAILAVLGLLVGRRRSGDAAPQPDAPPARPAWPAPDPATAVLPPPPRQRTRRAELVPDPPR